MRHDRVFLVPQFPVRPDQRLPVSSANRADNGHACVSPRRGHVVWSARGMAWETTWVAAADGRIV